MKRARRESEGPGSGKPVMIIDGEKIPHGFIAGKWHRLTVSEEVC
jgi:hypothetical protein